MSHLRDERAVANMDGKTSKPQAAILKVFKRGQTYPSISTPACSGKVYSEDAIREGFLHKRSRARTSPKPRIQRVQKRYILLTKDALYYYPDKVKGGVYDISLWNSFSVRNMKIVEEIDDSEIGANSFQVGSTEEIMYFRASSNSERENWMKAFVRVANLSGNSMCTNYHPKIYKKNSGQWGCCMSTDSEREGCQTATSSMRFLLAYKEQLTPSQAMEMSLATRPIHGRQSCPVKIRPDGLHSKKGETDSPCVPTHHLTSGDSPSDGSFQNSKRTDSGIYSLEDRMLPNLGRQIYSLGDKDGSCEGMNLNSYSPNRVEQVPSDEILVQNGLEPLVHRAFESSVSIAHFTDVDQIALATTEKLHIMDLTKIEDVFQSEVMPISLRSWSTLVVMQTAENKVSLMDTRNMSEAYTWTSESFGQVEFTPDGKSVLGSDFKNGSYLLEHWDISSTPVTEIGSIVLPGKPKKLCVHPDPRIPLVAAIAEHETFRVLFMYVYNYRTHQLLHNKICLVSAEPHYSLHTAYSSEDSGLIYGYGKLLAVADIKQGDVRCLEDINVPEDVSSIGVAPSGTELVLGHTNGTISVLHMENYKWKAKYHLDLQYNCPITAASYCFDNSKLAVATENGNLNIFRRISLPLLHPSEELQLETMTILQSGGHRDLQDDISIDFPPGFTESSSGMSFQYGVFSPYELGPCVLPEGTSLVSAILALHPASQHTTFNEGGIKITMPHFSRLETAEDCSKINVLKAGLDDYEITNEGKVLSFQKVSDHEVSPFTRLQEIKDCGQVGVPYVSFDSLHCCFYCIVKEIRKEKTENANFCIAQFKPKSLGNSSEFEVQYTLSYFLETCYKNLNDQYPEAEYDRKMKVVQFKEQDESIEIKINNDAQMMETSGWIAEVTKGRQICKQDVCFWNFPRETVKWMCDEKQYPPGFTIKICTTEYESRNIDLAVVFPGAVIARSRCKDGATIDYTVELKTSDVLPEAAQERMVVLSPAEILNSSQSYEAIAAQMCTREIAEGVDSPDQFLMALFSKMLLTREEVESLRMDLQFTSLKEKRDKNFYIMLKVHRKISEDSRLFFNLCGALEDIYYFRFKKTLYDALKRTSR